MFNRGLITWTIKLLILYSFNFRVDGQCRYEYFSNFTDVCGTTDFVPNLIDTPSASLNFPHVCNSFNESCYLDANECIQSYIDEFQIWTSGYTTLQFVCNNLNDLASFQKCSASGRFIQDRMTCDQISNPLDFCTYLNQLVTCYVNISRVYCSSEVFFCNFVQTYYATLASANGCTFQTCDTLAQYNLYNWLVYAIIGGTCFLIFVVAVAVCCYAYRSIEWFDPYYYDLPPLPPQDCSCYSFDCCQIFKRREEPDKNLLKQEKIETSKKAYKICKCLDKPRRIIRGN